LNENEDSKTLSDRQNPRISGDVGLQIVRLSHHACQVNYETYYEILKQICLALANWAGLQTFWYACLTKVFIKDVGFV